MRILGVYLEASRVAYTQITDEEYVIAGTMLTACSLCLAATK